MKMYWDMEMGGKLHNPATLPLL